MSYETFISFGYQLLNHVSNAFRAAGMPQSIEVLELTYSSFSKGAADFEFKLSNPELSEEERSVGRVQFAVGFFDSVLQTVNTAIPFPRTAQ